MLSLDRRRALKAFAGGAIACVGAPQFAQGNLLPSRPSGNRTAIEHALKGGRTVQLGSGVYILDGTLHLPAESTLLGNGSTTLMLSSDAADKERSVVSMSNHATISQIIVDGNLFNREEFGSLKTYVFGIVIEGASFCFVENCSSINCGATKEFFVRSGGNGGGYLIDAENSDAIGNIIKNCVSFGPEAGFHARIITDFRGVGAIARAERNIISGLRGGLGNKNAIELVGPRTMRNSVSHCSIFAPQGQGGIEADFGASLNRFEDCTVTLDSSQRLSFTLDCFSQRTMPKNGRLFVPHGNKFIRCIAKGEAHFNGHAVRGFTCFGAGREARFIDPIMAVASLDRGGKVIGYYQEARYQAISAAEVTNARFSKGTIRSLIRGKYAKRADN